MNYKVYIIKDNAKDNIEIFLCKELSKILIEMIFKNNRNKDKKS